MQFLLNIFPLKWIGVPTYLIPVFVLLLVVSNIRAAVISGLIFPLVHLTVYSSSELALGTYLPTLILFFVFGDNFFFYFLIVDWSIIIIYVVVFYSYASFRLCFDWFIR